MTSYIVKVELIQATVYEYYEFRGPNGGGELAIDQAKRLAEISGRKAMTVEGSQGRDWENAEVFQE